MSKRLLLVEDEPDVARLLVYNLEAAGWTVTHAARGLDALARARVDDPVVVILDVMLPDMSGFDVCKRLREAPESADVGIMMLTARGDPDDRITGLEVGAGAHEVTLDGAPLALRPLEYKLLLTLAAVPGRVFTREDLLAEVWDIRGSVSTRTVDVHVRRLRVSLGAAADWIETVHGFGYRARRDGEAPAGTNEHA
ncbi:MAG: response regulator transcription factor [Deltaproteobacteria bacterium]|nr:response regulator transcription factor [Kofleriaceae bacterium]